MPYVVLCQSAPPPAPGALSPCLRLSATALSDTRRSVSSVLGSAAVCGERRQHHAQLVEPPPASRSHLVARRAPAAGPAARGQWREGVEGTAQLMGSVRGAGDRPAIVVAGCGQTAGWAGR